MKINNVPIEQAKFTKFLGVIINENIWSNQMQVLLSKTSKSLDIISKISYTLPCTALLSLYYTLILLFTNIYNSAILHGVACLFHKLMSNQKKAVHLID